MELTDARKSCCETNCWQGSQLLPLLPSLGRRQFCRHRRAPVHAHTRRPLKKRCLVGGRASERRNFVCANKKSACAAQTAHLTAAAATRDEWTLASRPTCCKALGRHEANRVSQRTRQEQLSAAGEADSCSIQVRRSTFGIRRSRACELRFSWRPVHLQVRASVRASVCVCVFGCVTNAN